ncbi:Uu.00g129220.m01.CDS01 [Anthostomella pinea]|uniref:Uu.00g129220.m01.CDS01 n=1 Tax=Anthostomella pinea TaxID=933095 RepID=A0AAI8VID9_9PEZI|nr:Uu.00g129220.m01.CDS01 [Anthostomella pinea]
MHAAELPFAVHGIIETVAALSFIFNPEKQLPGCTPAAKLILRQYGGLLLASGLVCLAVLIEPGFNDLKKMLAMAMGSYHAWPCYRAYVRIRQDTDSNTMGGSALGGPSLHLVVHLICLAMFAFAAASPTA